MNRDRGQAAVELALALPLVAVLVLGIVQLVVIARDQLAVELAAREGARAAAVAADPAGSARAAAGEAVGLDGLDIEVSFDRRLVTVVVRHQNATDVPLVGLLVGDVTVTASVTMQRDPPPP